MSNKLPREISNNIKELVFKVADEFHYLSKTRTENGKFLDQLVSMPHIGGVLNQYMKKAEIRTYIKDAILNRYSKDKTLAAKPKDMSRIIKTLYDLDTLLIDSDISNKIELYKSIENETSCFVIVADGTVLKWETALRKALLYTASKPFSENEENCIFILLNIFAQHKPVPYSDKVFLNKALSKCGAQVNIFGED